MRTPQKLLFLGVEVTRSLSNLIKYYHFNVTEDDKCLVDNDAKVGQFVPGLFCKGQVEVEDEERQAFDEEFPEELFEQEQLTESDAEEISEEQLERLHQEAERILEEARLEADKILEQAKATAQFEKETLLEEARKTGYKEGLIKANDEVAGQKAEVEAFRQELENSYQQKVAELEPNFVDVVIGLVKKMTGVLVEDRRDVIVYLMERAMQQLGRTENLMICVSAEDYDLVLARKESLTEILSDTCQLEVIKDDSLQQNQCVLEADNQIIDCSLDVQLQGLIEDLKMLK